MSLLGWLFGGRRETSDADKALERYIDRELEKVNKSVWGSAKEDSDRARRN
jgi:hypothetical protein